MIVELSKIGAVMVWLHWKMAFQLGRLRKKMGLRSKLSDNGSSEAGRVKGRQLKVCGKWLMIRMMNGR
jgi:hypothetical protein